MTTALKNVSIGKYEGIPPRERILAVAAELFYRHGIRAVGVEFYCRGGRNQQDDPLPSLHIKGRAGRGIPALFGGEGEFVVGQLSRPSIPGIHAPNFVVGSRTWPPMSRAAMSGAARWRMPRLSSRKRITRRGA